MSTYAEVMVQNLAKIAEALQQLQASPLPRELIFLYVQKRTRLPKTEIEAVFNAVEELNKKVQQKKPIQ